METKCSTDAEAGPLTCERTQISQKTVKVGNYVFLDTTYCDFEVRINCGDGYVNATKFCNEISHLMMLEFKERKKEDKNLKKPPKKHARKFFRLDCWKEICAEHNEIQTHEYEISDVPNAFKGTFIHPDLIHYVVHWASPKYAKRVSQIMNEINRRAHLKGIKAEQNFQEVLSNLQSENEELRKQLAAKSNVIETQDKLIDI